MKEVISERAKIREMDASEIEQYYQEQIKVADPVLLKLDLLHMLDDFQLCNKQYLQLTGNTLF